jgi:hypothetical protein
MKTSPTKQFIHELQILLVAKWAHSIPAPAAVFQAGMNAVFSGDRT